MKHFCKALPVLLAILALTACNSARKLSYLTDMEYGVDYPAPPAPELIIQPEDCLGIQLSSETPELAAPFNVHTTSSSTGETVAHRYIVDRDGNIDFPVLGTLHVGGKTLKQIKELVADGIRQKGYIREPIVLVTLDNFTVTVIGKIGNTVLPVVGNSINILQVIARCDNITNQSKIKDVMVVRTEDGVRKAYSVNLQSKDLFTSPVFYLKQQDVVYVKPQGTSLSPSGQTAMLFVSSGLSLLTILSNFFLWYTRY